jgi:hypothetical protein
MIDDLERCVRDDMALPSGKTCGDCHHHKFCKQFFGCPATNTRCDWSPSRFFQRANVKESHDARD